MDEVLMTRKLRVTSWGVAHTFTDEAIGTIVIRSCKVVVQETLCNTQ